MMPTTNDCPCNHLISLTQQSNFEELHQCLLNGMVVLYPNYRGITIYSGKFQLNDSHDSVSILAEEGQHEGPHTLSHTIEQQDQVLATLVIYSDEPLNHSPQLTSLILVYTNMYQHLRRTYLDTLTRLRNRQSFDETVMNLRYRRKRRRCGDEEIDTNVMAIVDIDHFKQINDQRGHLFGDEVLLIISQLMTQTFREEDFLFRYGGEEFVFILTNITLENAQMVLERFRQITESHKFPQDLHVTISTGFTLMDPVLDTGTLLERADRALYYAKENGRNRCCSYEELAEHHQVEAVSIRGGFMDVL